MEKVTFYREWLPLPKAEFNVLTMLAEQGGSFSGNKSESSNMNNVIGVNDQLITSEKEKDAHQNRGQVFHFALPSAPSEHIADTVHNISLYYNI